MFAAGMLLPLFQSPSGLGTAPPSLFTSPGVKFIPTMLVYNAKTGQEVARHVVASRGEFLVKFLEEADKFSSNLQH